MNDTDADFLESLARNAWNAKMASRLEAIARRLRHQDQEVAAAHERGLNTGSDYAHQRALRNSI